MNQLFRTKSIEHLHEEAHGEQHGFKKTLSAFNLTALGVGAVIGAGIFVISGRAAAQFAGPGIIISFVISAIACALAGLCYAEFASMIPISGSAYTYGYATLGEIIAWIIGWALVLEYLFAASTVAASWTGYFVSFLNDFGISIPVEYTSAIGTKLIHLPKEGWYEQNSLVMDYIKTLGLDASKLPTATGIVNLPAIILVMLVTTLLVVGIKESAKFNNIMVIIKVSVILLFIALGFAFIKKANLVPFIPENTGDWGHYGFSGILRGASVIFFAYIGFDAVSTAAQEAKNPKRDMPIAILGSLGISTILYILVALVMTGVISYKLLNVPHPIAYAVNAMGPSMFWLRPVIKVAAIAGLSSVVLVLLMGQPRVFFTMSKDGLLPPVFSKIHPKFKTPYLSSIISGVVACLISGFMPSHIIGELVNMGTLLAFVIVCIGVLMLRYKKPNLLRSFKTPFLPWVPVIGALMCATEMLSLPLITWVLFLSWMVVGLIIYFTYSMKHSKNRLFD